MTQDRFYQEAKLILEIRKQNTDAMAASKKTITLGTSETTVSIANAFANALETTLEYNLLKEVCKDDHNVDFEQKRKEAKLKMKEYFNAVSIDSPELSPGAGVFQR